MFPGDLDDAAGAMERNAPPHVEFYEATDTYRTSFDPADRPTTEAVVSAVSAATGTDAMELPPIYGAVDPDALCAFFGATSSGPRRFRGSVSFEYADTLVTVDGRGTIEVETGHEGRERSAR